MLRCQKQLGQWRNIKTRRLDLRTIYPLYFSPQTQMVSVIASLKSYGQFWSTIQQQMSSPSTPKTLTYNNSGPFKDMTYSGSQITVQYNGVYEVIPSIQLRRLSGGTATTADVWIRVNGFDLADSAIQTVVPGGSATETFVCFAILLPLNAGDNFEVVFATNDPTNTVVEYFPAFTNPPDPYDRPAVPSIITTVKQLE